MIEGMANNTLKGRALNDGASGLLAHAHIRIAVDVVDAQTVLIGADTYEFDDDSTFTAGNIQVDVTGTLTPADATDALIAAINASGKEAVRAIDLGANDILLVSTQAFELELALSETMGGAGNDIDAAMAGGITSTLEKVHCVSVVPSANEIAAGLIIIPLDFIPTGAIVSVVVTATGIPYAWNGGVKLDLTDNLIKIDNVGATNWAGTETVNVLVF